MTHSTLGDDASTTHDERLRVLAAQRLRIAVALTVTMVVIYFGFIALIAFDRPLLATRVVPGLTLGILLGALVIVVSWLLTYAYVRWANTHYDGALRVLQEESSRVSRGGIR